MSYIRGGSTLISPDIAYPISFQVPLDGGAIDLSLVFRTNDIISYSGSSIPVSSYEIAVLRPSSSIEMATG